MNVDVVLVGGGSGASSLIAKRLRSGASLRATTVYFST